MLLAEHRYKPIEGNVLFIGRQTTHLDEASLGRLLQKHGIKAPASSTLEFDTETRGASGERFITDRCLMRSLGVDTVSFLDVTDYEGADIVHDLGYPVPDALANRYDFIYNGGCLDNMFNPGVALANLSKMLRPGGRVVCLEAASSFNAPYLMYSPGWFWDYYVVNGFADCKIYIGSFHDGEDLVFGPWDLFHVNVIGEKATWQQTNGPAPVARDNNNLVVVSVAEKGPESSSDRQPIQLQYRVDPALAAECRAKAEAIRSNRRPVAFAHEGQTFERYVTPLGKVGAGIHSRSLIQRVTRLIRRQLRALKIVARIFTNRSVA